MELRTEVYKAWFRTSGQPPHLGWSGFVEDATEFEPLDWYKTEAEATQAARQLVDDWPTR